jgi:hypothetical protein
VGAGNMFLDLRNNSLEDNTKEYNLIHASTGTFKIMGMGTAVVTNANIQSQNIAGTGNVSGNVVFSNSTNPQQPSFAFMRWKRADDMAMAGIHENELLGKYIRVSTNANNALAINNRLWQSKNQSTGVN